VNLIFLALLDNFVSFFRDEVFSNINTADLAGKNVRDLLKSYFEENPIVEPDPGGTGYNFMPEGIANLQNVIANVSFGDSLVASAPILLLAASVVIIMGVLGEAFFKKTGIPDILFLMVLGIIIGIFCTTLVFFLIGDAEIETQFKFGEKSAQENENVKT